MYYKLNQTCNILICTDIPVDQILPGEILKEFSSVTVFCAAMMNSIHNTINPFTNQPFSMYNYHAIESILTGSKRFIKTSEKVLYLKENKTIEDFIDSLYQMYLGISVSKKEMRTINSILGKLKAEALRMIDADNVEQFKIGHITFIVEYINGEKKIQVKTLFINLIEKKENLEIALNKSWHHSSWKIHTETFLYISKH